MLKSRPCLKNSNKMFLIQTKFLLNSRGLERANAFLVKKKQSTLIGPNILYTSPFYLYDSPWAE